ncbi:T9SS C-terminal target domain-containing protein [Fluviicola taffensis]|uniref:Ig domain protein group 2 domain protein n=1 Tax=Fluviicola taffensis (strain DSM 16823 / NCIMB 13979 / RW262) TaxID=755732 RepID=F2IB30_FLUTR|nr:T9SS C-terminal target domain-containing protein [Fluviicola taffensis]AEA42113.1 Ig domain protein group 2 domain protein [Fluviicola taffensis DSM 16823]
MKKLIYLFIFILVSISGYGQPPCGSNPAAGNTCATATPICELNGYCGNTSSSYTPDAWGSAGAPFGCGFLGLSSCPGTGLIGAFCGSLENDSYLSFVASSSSVSIDVWVYNSTYGDGIQIMIFSGACGGNITSYYCDQLTPSASAQTVSATGLTPGNTYYILIDGFAGDVCDYTFAASSSSGISIPVDVTPVTSTICAGQSVTLTATGGNGTYNWNASPNLSGTTGAVVTATPPSTPGTYTYTVNSSGGNPMCPSATMATASITVNSCGGCTVSAGNSGDVCEGAPTFNLTATNVAGATWNWVGPNGFTSNVQNPTSVPVPTTAGSYTYTVTATVAGVPCTSTTTLVVNPTPTINAPISSICIGGTTSLTGSGTPHASTAWVSSNTAVATVSSSGVVTAVSVGTTTITYMNSGGCTITQVITVISLPTATIAGSTTICSGLNATITFAGTPNATVTYQVGGGPNQTILLDAAGNASLPVTPTTTTTYSLVSVQMNPPTGCSSPVTGSATVIISAPPTVDAVTSISVCSGATVSVPAFVSNPTGATFTWTNSNPSIGLAANGTGDIASFTGVNPGSSANTATITITPSLSGCVGTNGTFTISVLSPPIANAGTDVNICVNALSGNQIGQPPVAGNTYSWSPTVGLSDATIANPTVDISAPRVTNYVLTITNAGSCSSTDNVLVTINDLPAISISSDVISGCNPQNITFSSNVTNAVNCTWTFEGFGSQNVCGTVSQNYTNAGTFDVGLTVTDLNGCTNSVLQSDMITIFSQPDASFTATPTILTIDFPTVNTTNTSTDALTYTWDFGDGSTSTAFSPSHTYPETAGSYTIVLYAASGPCIDSAKVTVEIQDDLTYYIPNTFTPDGDEYNNVFKPIFNDAFDKQSYTMLIFNRWGEVLFETKDTEFGWDGTYNGELCKEGTYTWKIVIKKKTKDYRIDLNGHITILK